MKRVREINYSVIINDDWLYILKNLDMNSLIKFSLVNRLNRLFSLSFIRDRLQLANEPLFVNLDNMINNCFGNQSFMILYQQLYIIQQ